MTPSLERVCREITGELEEFLIRSGIVCRIFARPKTQASIESKLLAKAYGSKDEGKLMQDSIGVRITFYFVDDLPIIYNFLQARDNYLDETVDQTEETVFKPVRINLVFRMGGAHAREVKETLVRKYTYIDTTYEIQLRTVFSEGWHEIDHDLRYKRPDDWSEHSDLARTFNGIYATLVTSDWAILSLFDQLAHRHYKMKSWDPMLRNKFRLRFRIDALDARLVEILSDDQMLAKNLFRLDRTQIIHSLMNNGVTFPLTTSNFLFFVNQHYLRDERIMQLMPASMIDVFL